MKQAALSIILAFILSVGIASCSHRPKVPFLDRLGVNTDSVLFDSLPNNFYSDSIGNRLTREQCDSLNTFYYHTKIVSIKQIGDNYLVTFIASGEGMFSILYDKEGHVLDKCHQTAVYYSTKGKEDSIAKGLIVRAVASVPPGCVNFRDFKWERHFVDNDKFEVTGRIQNIDFIIKYLYEVSNNKITQIKRTVTHNMKISHIDDIRSMPVSQTYLACDIINDIPNEPESTSTAICAISYSWIEPFVYYNTPAILKWISDHRENNEYVFKVFYGFYHYDTFDESNEYYKRVSEDFITKQIKQMKDKDARDYILKLFADEDAEMETE